jgi:adenine phosphoribosyltransferase
MNPTVEFDALLTQAAELVEKHTIVIQDFPREGIRYLDFFRTFERHPDVRKACLDCLTYRYRDSGVQGVAGIGTGGFGLGACMAHILGVPFISIRKASETVYDAYSASISMVYADRVLTLAKDAVSPGSRVLLMDDTIATGGSTLGALNLLSQAGATVLEVATIFETISARGRLAIAPTRLFTILSRDSF